MPRKPNQRNRKRSKQSKRERKSEYSDIPPLADAIRAITSYKPKPGELKQPSNPPPKKELERRWKMIYHPDGSGRIVMVECDEEGNIIS